jgi:UDP-2-acetamido-2,6-beta-L-arabino-hexul-4-ose reductase
VASVEIQTFDMNDSMVTLESCLERADVVFHLAGVNRPKNEEDFMAVNVGLTSIIVQKLREGERKPTLVLASSIQAARDSSYGRSKLKAEEAVEVYAAAGGKGVIYRLPNVFGKWSRPDYNSVVATFCHNIARDLPIEVSDPAQIVQLVYVDDVVMDFLSLLKNSDGPCLKRMEVQPVFEITLGNLVKEIRSFKDIRRNLTLPDLGDSFRKALFATYTSFLPENGLNYSLTKQSDERGSLAEMLKSSHFGQIFVSRTKPGVTRGNHWHDTKVEKFCVVEGEAIIRFRRVDLNEVISYPVRGTDFQVVDIPPGYSHSIENVGETDLVVLFWSSEIFDEKRSDTHPMQVSNAKE